MRNLRRWILPSGAAHNLRDLGGYACEGGVTRFNVVLRSDQLFALNDADKRLLLDNGLTDVIDLRSDGERRAFPNSFLDDAQVNLHTVKLNHEMDEFQFSPNDFKNMGEMYIAMVDTNGREYTRMLKVIASAQGISIVHCMAGKDRTGIVCALLLLLLGVNRHDVVADYQITMTYLGQHIMGTFMSDNPEMPQYLASSDPSNLWQLIEHLNAKYSGAEAYLKVHGLTEFEKEKLRQRIVAQQ